MHRDQTRCATGLGYGTSAQPEVDTPRIRAEDSVVDLSKNQQLIADLLASRQRLHAYEIKKILQGVLGHGSVYQALSAMESKGAVASEWELPSKGSEGGGPPRKYFHLTTLGKDLLEIAHARDRATARAERRAKRATPAR